MIRTITNDDDNGYEGKDDDTDDAYDEDDIDDERDKKAVRYPNQRSI